MSVDNNGVSGRGMFSVRQGNKLIPVRFSHNSPALTEGICPIMQSQHSDIAYGKAFALSIPTIQNTKVKNKHTTPQKKQ